MCFGFEEKNGWTSFPNELARDGMLWWETRIYNYKIRGATLFGKSLGGFLWWLMIAMRHTTTATMHFFTSEKDTSILRCFDHRASKSWLKVCVEHIAKARSIHIPRWGVAVRVLFLEVVVSPSSNAFDIKKPSLRSLERSQESSPWKSLDTLDVPVFACWTMFGM